jgi:hypothetical protein
MRLSESDVPCGKDYSVPDAIVHDHRVDVDKVEKWLRYEL